MREVVAERGPSASVWKASTHRLVDGPLAPDYIEAAPDALWERTDPFRTYHPAEDRGAWSKPSPHETFAKLADIALNLEEIEDLLEVAEIAPDADALLDTIEEEELKIRVKQTDFDLEGINEEERKLLHRAVEVFANTYGLLGLFWEEFGGPLLPERKLSYFAGIAPDAVIGRDKKLREIDPATEGKRLLTELTHERITQPIEKPSEWPPFPVNVLVEPVELIVPGELRFQKRVRHYAQTGSSQLPSDDDYGAMFTYEDVRRRYGVYAVFDPQNADRGVSLVSTREPVSVWREEFSAFTSSLYQDFLNANLEDVRPLLVTDKNGRAASSWYCPSLMKAIHLMRYLDLVAGVRMQRCQAPGCREYFRVGPGSRESLYCPPPPGKNQSKCASRASSAMYRERQRRKA